MSDSISNFITIIRNASRAGKEFSVARYSKLHQSIAEILKKEGYIREFSNDVDKNGHKNIVIKLKYVNETPALTGIQRYSKSGCRSYFGYNDIPRVLGGLGIGILTTSNGLMIDREARKKKIGGELICTVW